MSLRKKRRPRLKLVKLKEERLLWDPRRGKESPRSNFISSALMQASSASKLPIILDVPSKPIHICNTIILYVLP
jgi:hypothetical protein